MDDFFNGNVKQYKLTGLTNRKIIVSKRSKICNAYSEELFVLDSRYNTTCVEAWSVVAWTASRLLRRILDVAVDPMEIE